MLSASSLTFHFGKDSVQHVWAASPVFISSITFITYSHPTMAHPTHIQMTSREPASKPALPCSSPYEDLHFRLTISMTFSFKSNATMLSPSMLATVWSPLTPAQASTYLQRSVFLPHPHLARCPAVHIMGQYSKPRSYPYEQISNHQVLSLGACSVPRPTPTLTFKKRGNIVNSTPMTGLQTLNVSPGLCPIASPSLSFQA